jgi:hypothetical protein
MPTPLLPNPVTEATVAPPAPARGLRVAFLTHYAELYGANLSLLNLIEGLGRHGVSAHVISPEQGDLSNEFSSLPGRHHSNRLSLLVEAWLLWTTVAASRLNVPRL